MDLVTGETITLLINGLLIAVVITFPVLVGMIVLSIFRKRIKTDQEQFETKVISMLEQIRDAQVTSEKQP
jgi:large-conductance mechanosensitive channel